MTADAIAMKLGIEKTATVRVRAGIGHALAEAMDEGHCGLPEEELGPLAAKLLEVPSELIRTALDLEAGRRRGGRGYCGRDTPCIFLGGLLPGRAHDCRASLSTSPPASPHGPGSITDKALPWVEQQDRACPGAPARAMPSGRRSASKVSVITGGPGVGKTTIVNAILRILSAKGVDILLCAPTGRAGE